VPKAIWWTAPEIVRTQWRRWGAPADVWSVGCVVLEMLTGMRPWFDTEAVAVVFKVSVEVILFDCSVLMHLLAVQGTPELRSGH
jgi:serine/threonine protein kinase